MNDLITGKYRQLRPLNDEAITHAMLQILVDVPPSQQNALWHRGETGSFCIFRHDKFPGKVIEYVQGSKNDSVTTLYVDCPLFESLNAVADMRKQLQYDVAARHHALPSSISFFDHGRERDVVLTEMGTAQLYDMIAQQTGRDVLTA